MSWLFFRLLQSGEAELTTRLLTLVRQVYE